MPVSSRARSRSRSVSEESLSAERDEDDLAVSSKLEAVCFMVRRVRLWEGDSPAAATSAALFSSGSAERKLR